MMHKVISSIEYGFVRDWFQPPTFPRRFAAIGTSRTSFSPAANEELRIMKNFAALGALLSVSAALAIAMPGCKTPVDVSGSFGVPGTNITAAVDVATNAVSLTGAYQTGPTNIDGTITVGK